MSGAIVAVPATEADLAREVAAAAAAREPLAIEGRGTKRALLRPVQAARTLSTRALTGVTLYRPTELIISARAGGVQRFTARLLSDNLAMRHILDRFGAEWDRDEPGVVVTDFDVPEPDQVRIAPELADEIRSVTRQVIRASVG